MVRPFKTFLNLHREWPTWYSTWLRAFLTYNNSIPDVIGQNKTTEVNREQQNP